MDGKAGLMEYRINIHVRSTRNANRRLVLLRLLNEMV